MFSVIPPIIGSLTSGGDGPPPESQHGRLGRDFIGRLAPIWGHFPTRDQPDTSHFCSTLSRSTVQKPRVDNDRICTVHCFRLS